MRRTARVKGRGPKGKRRRSVDGRRLGPRRSWLVRHLSGIIYINKKRE
jgi:hypothetical protein